MAEPPMPDLSHLSAEEREIIEQVDWFTLVSTAEICNKNYIEYVFSSLQEFRRDPVNSVMFTFQVFKRQRAEEEKEVQITQYVFFNTIFLSEFHLLDFFY